MPTSEVLAIIGVVYQFSLGMRAGTRHHHTTEVTEVDHHEKYQANAPAVSAGLYVVPRVIE